MITPEVDQVDEENEVKDEDHGEEGEETNEEDIPKKTSFGLKKAMLDSLQETSKVALSPVTKANKIQVQESVAELPHFSQTLASVEEKIETKFDRLTFRPRNLNYNDRNITSVNEIIALQNYQKLFPSLRL